MGLIGYVRGYGAPRHSHGIAGRISSETITAVYFLMYGSLRHRHSVVDYISIVAIASVHPPSIYVYKASRHDHGIAGCISVGIASVYGSVHSASRHRYSIVASISMFVHLSTSHLSGYLKN